MWTGPCRNDYDDSDLTIDDRYIVHHPVLVARRSITATVVVWPTTSCFADWSKRRHVTLSIIEWRTIHGHDLVRSSDMSKNVRRTTDMSKNIYCRLTNYELLRWLVETPSRDFAHYRLSWGRRIFTTCQEVTSRHVDTCHEVRSWHVVNILRAAWSRVRSPPDH